MAPKRNMSLRGSTLDAKKQELAEAQAKAKAYELQIKIYQLANRRKAGSVSADKIEATKNSLAAVNATIPTLKSEVAYLESSTSSTSSVSSGIASKLPWVLGIGAVLKVLRVF